MIILHPDQIVRLDHRGKARCKALIDALVAILVLGIIVDKVSAIVQQRPEDAVGIALIKLGEVFLGHVKGCERDRRRALVVHISVDRPPGS